MISDDCIDLMTQASLPPHKTFFVLDTELGSGAWLPASLWLKILQWVGRFKNQGLATNGAL